MLLCLRPHPASLGVIVQYQCKANHTFYGHLIFTYIVVFTLFCADRKLCSLSFSSKCNICLFNNHIFHINRVHVVLCYSQPYNERILVQYLDLVTLPLTSTNKKTVIVTSVCSIFYISIIHMERIHVVPCYSQPYNESIPVLY